MTDDEELLTLLTEAYQVGHDNDGYADGDYQEVFTIAQGKHHRHIMGLAFAAEQLVAVYTGRPWLNATNQGVPDRGDVEGLAVRHASRPQVGLRIRSPKDDNVKVPFVLVTGETIVELRVRGWMWKEEVKRDEWFKEHWDPPCWEAPQSALHPMSELNGGTS